MYANVLDSQQENTFTFCGNLRSTLIGFLDLDAQLSFNHLLYLNTLLAHFHWWKGFDGPKKGIAMVLLGELAKQFSLSCLNCWILFSVHEWHSITCSLFMPHFTLNQEWKWQMKSNVLISIDNLAARETQIELALKEAWHCQWLSWCFERMNSLLQWLQDSLTLVHHIKGCDRRVGEGESLREFWAPIHSRRKSITPFERQIFTSFHVKQV